MGHRLLTRHLGRIVLLAAFFTLFAVSLMMPVGAMALASDETVDRLAGVDRFGSAVAVAEDGFPSGADVVFVATGSDFPDAVVAAAGASAAGGPVLLVGRDSVPDSVRGVLGRWSPSRVVVVGGPQAVSDAVVAELERLAGSVDRLAGVDRFGSAVAVAEDGFPSGADVVFVATGSDFPDAVVAAAGASAAGGPVLLVGRDSVPDSVRGVLGRWSPSRVVVVGGPQVISGKPFLELVGMFDDVSITGPIGPHPYDHFELSWFDSFTKDELGVILHPDFDPPYHPLVIPRYATTLYAERYLVGDVASIDDVAPQLQWLVENRVAIGDMDTWPAPFTAWYGKPVGWISSMYQAFTISALLQWADAMGEEPLYSGIVERALRVFYRDVAEGGVLTMQGPKDFWYEEYATPQRTRVLNGHIWALGGLYLAARDADSRTAALLFDYGVNALVEHLDEYDTGFTSLYALDPGIHPNYAGPLRYNSLHIDQLLWVYHVTGNRLFYDMAERFLDYQGGSFDVVAVSGPASNGTDPLVVLTDGYIWSGSWNPVSSPQSVTLDLGSPVVLDEVAFSVAGSLDSLPPVSVAVSSNGLTFGSEQSIDPSPVAVGHQDAVVPTTSVFVFRVPRETGRFFRFTIESPPETRVEAVPISVREINVHFDQRDHLDERYASLIERFDRR